MCGIVGVLSFGEQAIVPSYNASALYLATNLLESSESRGGDATGVTALFDNGNFFIQKMAIGAAEFVTRSGGSPDDYEGLMAILRGYDKAHMRCFLGHCRKKSAGALSNTDNHPIKAGNIVGVHNGTLKNDKEIFTNLQCERDGKVDSEAIFRLLQHYTENCTTPFTTESVVESCVRLEGTYSFLAYNANNPFQVVSARDGRPVEYCLIKPLGIVLIASDSKFIDRALWSYNKQARLFPSGNPETEFVALKKDDVENGSIANDTAAIFDLTKEITPETKLADLYTTEKIPFQTKPNWKSAVTTVYGNNSYHGHGAGYNHHSADKGNGSYSNGFSGGNNAGKKKDTTNTSKTNQSKTGGQSTGADSKKNNSNVVGKVWDSKLEQFVTVFGKRELIDHGTVTDIEKGTNTKLKDAVTESTLDNVDAEDAKKTTTSGMEPGDVTSESKDGSPGKDLNFHIDPEQVENYNKGERVPVIRVNPPVDTTSHQPTKTNNTAVKDMKKGIDRVKNNINTPKKANEAAVLAAKGMSKFSDNDELATFIGLDTGSLDQLPASSLANRIIKNLFGKFFIEGWEACAAAQTEQTDDPSGEKLSKAMKHIRVLKHLNTSLDSIVEIINAEEVDDDTVVSSTKLIAATLTSKHSEISKSTLNEIFSSGDFRKSKVLRSIVNNIK